MKLHTDNLSVVRYINMALANLAQSADNEIIMAVDVGIRARLAAPRLPM